jgi:hypothetical protein
MSSSAMGRGSVSELYKEWSALEKSWPRSAVDRLKFVLARDLTFRGRFFRAFSAGPRVSTSSDPELAARYRALVESFRKTQHPDDRLNLFAQWLWVELQITPEDALGEKEVERLSFGARKRLRGIPFNDMYYAQRVRIWLAYSERLFQDAKAANIPNRETHLRTLGYDPSAVEVFISKRWRSAVEFTCEWLATRGGIEPVKPRKDPDLARTLRNAYTKISGRGAPRLL